MSQLFRRLESGAARCGWLTLDARDDDLTHLLTHLQLALGAAGAKQPHVPDLGSWLNEVARLPGQQLLFLDEFESVQATGAIELLNRLLRFAPDNLCFVIGTRPESGLALGRLKASGQVLEWSVRQLRFDTQETEAFLHSPAGGGVPAAWHGLLAERCEGWPAIFRLSAQALSQSEAPHRFLEVLQDGSSDLAEYLAGEVYDRQSADHQHFLLCTSVLRTLTPRYAMPCASAATAPRFYMTLAAGRSLWSRPIILAPARIGSGRCWRIFCEPAWMRYFPAIPYSASQGRRMAGATRAPV